MDILILTGSPHPNGSSALLATSFVNGAKENGHNITRFDCATLNINPCRACEYCQKNNNQCIQKDDMDKIYNKLTNCDMVVFAFPVYYFGMCSQLKTVIDRFYCVNNKIFNKKTALLISAGGSKNNNIEGYVLEYELMSKYLKWSIVGKVLATSCENADDINNKGYSKEAFELGKSL